MPDMNYKHGLSKTPEWNVWVDMRKRCTKWKHPHFARYGGRGIKVCDRWSDFSLFLKDVGPKPSPKHTLDRINNDKGYNPTNVRWSTRQEQARNRRTSRFLTTRGKTQTLAAWAEETGMKTERIRMRIDRYGWSVDEALVK